MQHKRLKSFLLTTLMAVISLVAFIPFYMMFIMSTHFTEDLYKGLVLLPGDYLFININTAMQSGLAGFYVNSLIVSISSTVLCVLVSTMAGYALSKYRYKAREKFFTFILLSMMVPSQLGLVAYVIEMRYIGVVRTLYPLIFPWIANAFGVYWLRQYIGSAVPTEIIESGRIDGCSEPRILFVLVIPCITPALVTLMMLIFLWSWNSYLLPLVIQNNPESFTLPIGLSSIGDLYRVDHAAKIAGLTLGTLPLLVIFSFGSKSFLRGLTAGAIKA